MNEIKNAIIKSVSLDNADHGILTGWLNLDYGGSGRGFGGFCLYMPKSNGATPNYAGYFIWRVMETVGVRAWEDLPGKTIRVKAEHGRVSAIGHILEDKWFEPEGEFKKMSQGAKC